MTTAVLTLASTAAFVLVLLLVNFGCLYLVAHWFGAPHRGWRRLLLIGALLVSIGAVGIVAEKLTGTTPSKVEWSLVLIVFGTILQCAAFTQCLGLSGRKGTIAFLVYGGAWVLLGYAIVMPYKTYLVESFRASTMAQAPVLLSQHLTGTCPHCGAKVYIRYEPDAAQRRGSDTGICGRCWRSSEQEFKKDAGPQPADAFLVNKMVPMRRWDVIVYRFPEKPSVLYAKRLVGLPGETLVIRDGSVWIDGERLEAPVPVRPEMPGKEFGGDTLLGAPENPAKLGPDEYFILGDFTERSADSRFHGPIKREHLYGVVSVIYWPPSRIGVVK